jgi:uncharacterized protein
MLAASAWTDATMLVDPKPVRMRRDSTAGMPLRAGIGLRTPHYQQLLDTRPDIGWLEVHSENYFGAGGRPLQVLQRLREQYPLSLHGVGLSLGSTDPLDLEHVERLRALIERVEPGFVSEHLSWGSVGGRYLNDLVPLPYTEEALALVCRRIDELQQRLRRRILIENVSSYLQYRHSTIAEGDFVAAVARCSGCALLLDINNIYVSAVNHGFDSRCYLDAIEPSSVAEIHLAGHDEADGLLIDTHGQRVSAPVWSLYRQAIERFGARPTLIEWDTDIPPLAVLLDEARHAQRLMEEDHAVAA